MSLAGKHLGMGDDRFMPFLDMIRIVNFLQAEQTTKLLYLFENTHPGQFGQYPLVDDIAKMVESFLGAPVVIDAAGLGSSAHQIRLLPNSCTGTATWHLLTGAGGGTEWLGWLGWQGESVSAAAHAEGEGVSEGGPADEDGDGCGNKLIEFCLLINLPFCLFTVLPFFLSACLLYRLFSFLPGQRHQLLAQVQPYDCAPRPQIPQFVGG